MSACGNWPQTKLGDLVELNYGKALRSDRRLAGDYPVFSSAGHTGYHSAALVSSPGLIVGRKGTIGKIYYSDKPFWCIDTAYYILPDEMKYDLYFLYYLLQTLGFEELNEDSAVPGLNRETAYKQEFGLPSLPEQKAIASILSSLDDKIDLLHRQNKTLESLAETLFLQWFVEEAGEDWEEVTLKDVCSVITKGTTPTTLGHQFTDVGINFIKAESITDEGNFIPEKFAFIEPETHALLNRSILDDGDVLCSIAGTIGRVAIVDTSILPANTNQAVAILRTNPEKCFPDFIYMFLKSDIFREIMNGKIVHAVQPNLSLGEIGSIPFRLPPAEMLATTRHMFNVIFEKKRANGFQLRHLEGLRNLLLPKLLSGAVRLVS